MTKYRRRKTARSGEVLSTMEIEVGVAILTSKETIQEDMGSEMMRRT